MIALYCATTNPGKLREFEFAVENFGRGLIALEPLPGLRALEPPEETGETFEDNAIQKALYYGAHTTGYLLAEDSGLCADALGGEPGVYSARYSGPGATDASNNQRVLERMRGQALRSARFVCAAALVHGGRLVAAFQGSVEGEILEEERGVNGFGYDPLFYYPPFGCSFGEVAIGRKLEVSHRARALEKLLARLIELEKERSRE